METVIFNLQGGLGKHIASTAVINSYKYHNPDSEIVVVSPFHEIFKRNPNVSESLSNIKLQYFYKNYVYGKDNLKLFAHEPYKQISHIKKEKHLVDTWCDMIGIDHTEGPSLHTNFREREVAGNMLMQYSDKPILIFQPFGGPFIQQIPYCWARDIHPMIAQQMVNYLSQKYNVIHICNKHHPQLQNCVRMDDPIHPHVLVSLLQYSAKRILIDSCLQHAAYAMKLPSTVFWVATNPNVFGYDLHNNITPIYIDPEGDVDSFLFDYEIGGVIPECPYETVEELFDVQKIQELLENDF